MQVPLSYLKILVTLMTGTPKYNYWDIDNKKLVIPDAMLPSWIAVINGLEALQEDYEREYPEGGKDEQTKSNGVADSHDEEPGEPEAIQGSDE